MGSGTFELTSFISLAPPAMRMFTASFRSAGRIGDFRSSFLAHAFIPEAFVFFVVFHVGMIFSCHDFFFH